MGQFMMEMNGGNTIKPETHTSQDTDCAYGAFKFEMQRPERQGRGLE